MLALNMIHKRNYGYICIWTETINILDGDNKGNNTLKKILQRKKRKNESKDKINKFDNESLICYISLDKLS